jgi:hypothetical protein
MIELPGFIKEPSNRELIVEKSGTERELLPSLVATARVLFFAV